jgi:hypothetical protein
VRQLVGCAQPQLVGCAQPSSTNRQALTANRAHPETSGLAASEAESWLSHIGEFSPAEKWPFDHLFFFLSVKSKPNVATHSSLSPPLFMQISKYRPSNSRYPQLPTLKFMLDNLYNAITLTDDWLVVDW